MSRVLLFKILRDIRWPLLGIGLLLMAYEMLWTKITQRISEITPKLLSLFGSFQAIAAFEKEILKGPGEIIRAMLGGEMVNLADLTSLLSVGYIHPFVQTVFCIWAIGRAAGALSGEIDRGTMELLLAQPIARRQVILTHLVTDLLVIPVLCGCLIAGTSLGVYLTGLKGVDLHRFPGALANAAALIFAVSGFTMFLSSLGRFRWRVLSVALGLTLIQFLVNLLGQLWSVLTPFRPLTVFYYYQPQRIILYGDWWVKIGEGLPGLAEGEYLFTAHVVAVLVLIGGFSYALAYWWFCRRDLPAPL